MSSGRDEGPVYYREIQKNSYLKRIPQEAIGSKLRPLGHKKPPLKAMWTQFCVHNGRTPYLEQYPEPECQATLTHKPIWRVCLRTARHVTASVKPHTGQEYDFLVDTDHGAVRMLAPDWESMQDWVLTLRNKLHELKILSKGENVYCAPPAPPACRAAARDPMSPLPPTPPVPPDRVPGIEIAPTIRQPPTEPPVPDTPEPEAELPEDDVTITADVDISDWDTPSPSTSQERPETNKSVAKICGQNICLDDSIFKRTSDVTDSDEEFFAEIDRLGDSAENLNFEEFKVDGFRQTVVVNDEKAGSSLSVNDNTNNDRQSNITVIQVSNKDPPHTAIPVLGPETDVFDFEFKQKVNVSQDPSFVNIVNTETQVQNSNDYGTIFSKNDQYGHLSLTTTVNLTDDRNVNRDDSVYERLCMASTSNTKPSPLSVRRVPNMEKVRKSSLPNLDSTESAYEYLFTNQNNNRTNATVTVNNGTEVNSNTTDRHGPHVNSVSVNSDSSRVRERSNVERSHSQNACDASPRRDSFRRVQNGSPKREGKAEKPEPQQAKPIWKRGLTELSLLTRLRGIGQGKRQDSPVRNENGTSNNSNSDRSVTSPVKVVRRSRPEARVDSSRRRSSSLSNGDGPPVPWNGLQPLRARQAATLRAEQRRGAALVASLPTREPPVFADYNKQVWVSWWGNAGSRCNGRAGDRVCGLRGAPPRDANHARQLVINSHAHYVDILFHRVPLGKIYVVNKRDQECLGIKLDNECNITSVEADSPAARAGIPPPGKWAVTEVNNRPINLVKGGEEDLNRLALHGTEASILLQPSALVKKLRASIKGNRTLLGLR